MKVVVERFCPHKSPSSKPLVPGRKPSGVVRTGFGAPKKKGGPKRRGPPWRSGGSTEWVGPEGGAIV